MSEPSPDEVRAAAQAIWGEDNNHQDVRVIDEAPVEPVDDKRGDAGWWVQARVWVPR